MPVISIHISEEQEAKIRDAILKRRDFKIDGGRLDDGEDLVFLKDIKFSFHCSEHSRQVEARVREAMG